MTYSLPTIKDLVIVLLLGAIIYILIEIYLYIGRKINRIIKRRLDNKEFKSRPCDNAPTMERWIKIAKNGKSNKKD